MKYLNIIHSQTSCCILLYGEIGDYADQSANDFVTQLLEAEVAHKDIDVHINSIGGDVYAGIAILNALRQCKGNVTIYIDCIAASIASMIAVGCGKPIKMSRYARVMIHGVHGGVYGNKQDLQKCIDEVNRLDEILCEAYALRTGMTQEEIRCKYFDGQEHWLSAEEALSLGFVDEIYDEDNYPQFPESYDNRRRCEEYTNMYINKLNVQLKDKKMFDELQKMPGFTDCADQVAMMRRITEYKAKAEKYDALQGERDQLAQQVAAYKQKEVEVQDAADAAAIQKAIDEGRISADKKETYLALMKSDRDHTVEVIASLPAKRYVMHDIHNDDEDNDPWRKAKEEIDKNLKKQ